MPQPHSARLPLPKSADEFEDMCVEALRIRWKVQPQRIGRSGQAQQGVDITGRVGGEYLGAQCKNLGRVDLALVREAAEHARAFKPPLTSFLILTAAPRDARLQEAARVHYLRAGRAAEARHLGHGRGVVWGEDGAEDDEEQALRLANRVVGHPDEALALREFAGERAKSTVHLYWNAIAAVAVSLMEHGELAGQLVQEIIDREELIGADE